MDNNNLYDRVQDKIQDKVQDVKDTAKDVKNTVKEKKDEIVDKFSGSGNHSQQNNWKQDTQHDKQNDWNQNKPYDKDNQDRRPIRQPIGFAELQQTDRQINVADIISGNAV